MIPIEINEGNICTHNFVTNENRIVRKLENHQRSDFVYCIYFVSFCLPYCTLAPLSIAILSHWSSCLQCLLYLVLRTCVELKSKDNRANTKYLIYARPCFYIWPLSLSLNRLICQMPTISSHPASS